MITGKVYFQLMHKGSKSEGEYAFIKLEDGSSVKIHLDGDHPFKSIAMREYEGKYVAAEGEFNPYGTFIAKSVTVIDEPEVAAEPEQISLKDKIAGFFKKLFGR